MIREGSCGRRRVIGEDSEPVTVAVEERRTGGGGDFCGLPWLEQAPVPIL